MHKGIGCRRFRGTEQKRRLAAARRSQFQARATQSVVDRVVGYPELSRAGLGVMAGEQEAQGFAFLLAQGVDRFIRLHGASLGEVGSPSKGFGRKARDDAGVRFT